MTPLVTIILTSHQKPTLRDALNSVLAQTFADYECVVMDSGQWMDDPRIGLRHKRLIWVRTGEPPDLRNHFCPVAWATNEAIRAGLVRGKYVCTFYDDDVYEPTFLERMVGYLETTGEEAVWCSQNRVRLTESGETQPAGYIGAEHTLYPGMIDNRVDGGQVMFARAALMRMTDPWLPEDPADGSCRHSDGIFLERLCATVGKINPLDEMLYTHRFTPYSTYSR
jgi:glycosyl transferase family 2